MTLGPDPVFFESPEALRRWFEANAATAAEVVVGLRRAAKGAAAKNGPPVPLTWPQLVDECLCVGWIDGIRRGVEGGYSIRLTPRRRGSTWSAVNVARATALIAEGRMTPAGLAAFEARDPAKTAIYAYENRHRGLDEASEAAVRADPEAWAFFSAQPVSYRQLAGFWVTSARLAATRERRLAQLIVDSAAGRRIGPFRRAGE